MISQLLEKMRQLGEPLSPEPSYGNTRVYSSEEGTFAVRMAGLKPHLHRRGRGYQYATFRLNFSDLPDGIDGVLLGLFAEQRLVRLIRIPLHEIRVAKTSCVPDKVDALGGNTLWAA